MKKYSQEGCFFLCVFSTHSETSHYDENTSIWKYCIPKKTKHSSQKQKLFFRTSLECISFNLKFVIRRTHRISSRKYKFASNKRCEFSFHLVLLQTALVYQLQRRVRNLREQVQRKDLHLDLLRRKLNLQEDNIKNKCLLQNERDEANVRVKKLIKQVDHLQVQLSEAKSQIRDLNSQLAEAADFKVILFNS